MILLIDNYDSFSFNLYQMLGALDPDITVVRNDEITAGDIMRLAPRRIVLSPGPGRPADAGITIETVRAYAGKIPMLGVCLGHQAICEAFGAKIVYAKQLMHGKQSVVSFASSPLFSGLPERALVARYHSLAADPATIPARLRVTAATADGEVMAVEHTAYPVYGVQFHPESILTPDGKTILSNFLSDKIICGKATAREAV